MVVGLVLTVLGVVLSSPDPAKRLIAGVLGTVVVIGFFGVGQYVVGRVLERSPQIAMTAALLVYVLQILVLLLLLLGLRGASWLDGQWFGFAVFGGIVAWTLGMVVDYVRNRGLTVVPGSGPSSPDGPEAPSDRPTYDQ